MKFQTVYSGFVNVGAYTYSPHPSHSERTFRIGDVIFTDKELVRLQAMIKEYNATKG